MVDDESTNRAVLGSRGAHEELIEALVRRLPALHDSDGYGGDLISRDDLLEAFSETAAALRGVGTPQEKEIAVCQRCKAPVTWHKIKCYYDCTECGHCNGSAVLITRPVPGTPHQEEKA